LLAEDSFAACRSEITLLRFQPEVWSEVDVLEYPTSIFFRLLSDWVQTADGPR
jgi:hypothetical protein